MKRLLLISLVIAALPVCTYAQNAAFGLMIGRSEPTQDGVDFHLSNTDYEVFYEYPIEKWTSFRVKYGTLDSPVELNSVKGDGTIEYLDLSTAYEFDESYGHSSLFAGVGLYRQKLDTASESNYGFNVGVNGAFPVTRRFALIAEIGYHWANFDASTSFMTVNGGFKYSF